MEKLLPVIFQRYRVRGCVNKKRGTTILIFFYHWKYEMKHFSREIILKKFYTAFFKVNLKLQPA